MSRLRRAFRHLHRMAEPAAFMFDQPLSALSEGSEVSGFHRDATSKEPDTGGVALSSLSALNDLGVMPGTAASGLAAPRSLSALTEGELLAPKKAEDAPPHSAIRAARGGQTPSPSVSAFSSPPPYGAMPAWHENALNNPTRSV